MIGTEQLQKTNDLYLSITSLESSLTPLFEDYKHSSVRFHDSVSRMVDQYGSILERLEEI